MGEVRDGLAWDDREHDSFAWLVLGNHRTRCTARVAEYRPGLWLVEVEWFWWASKTLDPDFGSREDAKRAAEAYLREHVAAAAKALA